MQTASTSTDPDQHDHAYDNMMLTEAVRAFKYIILEKPEKLGAALTRKFGLEKDGEVLLFAESARSMSYGFIEIVLRLIAETYCADFIGPNSSSNIQLTAKKFFETLNLSDDQVISDIYRHGSRSRLVNNLLEKINEEFGLDINLHYACSKNRIGYKMPFQIIEFKPRGKDPVCLIFPGKPNPMRGIILRPVYDRQVDTSKFITKPPVQETELHVKYANSQHYERLLAAHGAFFEQGYDFYDDETVENLAFIHSIIICVNQKYMNGMLTKEETEKMCREIAEFIEQETNVKPTDDQIFADDGDLGRKVIDLVSDRFKIRLKPYYFAAETSPGYPEGGQIDLSCFPLMQEGEIIYLHGANIRIDNYAWSFNPLLNNETIPKATWEKEAVKGLREIEDKWGTSVPLGKNDDKNLIRAMVEAVNLKYNNKKLKPDMVEKLVTLIDEKIESKLNETPSAARKKLTTDSAIDILNNFFDLKLNPYILEYGKNDQDDNYYISGRPLSPERAPDAKDTICLFIKKDPLKPEHRMFVLHDKKKLPPQGSRQSITKIPDVLPLPAPVEQPVAPQTTAEPATSRTAEVSSPDVSQSPAPSGQRGKPKKGRRASGGRSGMSTGGKSSSSRRAAGHSEGTAAAAVEESAAELPARPAVEPPAEPAAEPPARPAAIPAEARMGIVGNIIPPNPGFSDEDERRSVNQVIWLVCNNRLPNDFLAMLEWGSAYHNREQLLPAGDYIHYRVRLPEDKLHNRGGSWRILRDQDDFLYLTKSHYRVIGNIPPFFCLGNLRDFEMYASESSVQRGLLGKTV